MILCDGHVHIYHRFDLNLFFLSAARNFSYYARTAGIGDAESAVFLADWSNMRWFDKLASFVGVRQSGQSFTVEPTREKTALRVIVERQKPFYVIASQKIITAEDLEVLALCTVSGFADGQPLRTTIASIQDCGAIAVIPWAVGKWMGRRGRILDDLLDHPGNARFYLSDNGNRPVFWGWPRHLKKAQHKGIPILSGSDPLHFDTEADRVGRCGFGLQGVLHMETPAGDIHAILKQFCPPLFCYGALESPLRFVRNQILMQLFKKKWRKELLKQPHGSH
jgi:hypothetical protein